jgi:hypothetical protein
VALAEAEQALQRLGSQLGAAEAELGAAREAIEARDAEIAVDL